MEHHQLWRIFPLNRVIFHSFVSHYQRIALKMRDGSSRSRSLPYAWWPYRMRMLRARKPGWCANATFNLFNWEFFKKRSDFDIPSGFIKHGWLENPLWKEVLMGKSLEMVHFVLPCFMKPEGKWAWRLDGHFQHPILVNPSTWPSAIRRVASCFGHPKILCFVMISP